jgi:hypothetical protein
MYRVNEVVKKPMYARGSQGTEAIWSGIEEKYVAKSISPV